MCNLLFAGAAAIAAGILLAQPAETLRLTNTDRGSVTELRIPGGGRFSVTYWHSMYGVPVTEEFAVGEDGALVLTTLRSPSRAALEYFGVSAAGNVHSRYARLPTVTMRIAMGEEQRLLVGDCEYSFLEFGEHGDRLILEHRRMHALRPQTGVASE